jgi:hypothetical protein
MDMDQAAFAWREALSHAKSESGLASLAFKAKSIDASCLEAIRREFAGFLWSWSMAKPEMAVRFLGECREGAGARSSAAEALIEGSAWLGLSMSGGKPPPFDLDASWESEEGSFFVSLRAAPKESVWAGLPGSEHGALAYERACDGFDARGFDLPTTVEGAEALECWDGSIELNGFDVARMDWSRWDMRFRMATEKLDIEASAGERAGDGCRNPKRV